MREESSISALQNNKYVETYSEGNEPYRHVVVTLKKIKAAEGCRILNWSVLCGRPLFSV